MSSFGEKLKLARKQKKISQEALAKLVGVSRVAITNYETNKNTPTYENIKKLSLILNMNFSDEETSVKSVPIVGTASCGACDINTLQDLTLKALISSDDWNMGLYAVVANGDSMANEIYDGDIAIIDPNIQLQSGDMVLYKIDDESAIKIFVNDRENNMYQFVPYNSNAHFKTRSIRLDDETLFERLSMHKVVQVVSIKKNNRAARLKMIGR